MALGAPWGVAPCARARVWSVRGIAQSMRRRPHSTPSLNHRGLNKVFGNAPSGRWTQQVATCRCTHHDKVPQLQPVALCMSGCPNCCVELAGVGAPLAGAPIMTRCPKSTRLTCARLVALTAASSWQESERSLTGESLCPRHSQHARHPL